MKKLFKLLVVVTLITSCKTHWPISYKFKDKTIGKELQMIFKSHAKSCDIVNIKNMTKEDSLNYIPSIITDIPGFNLDQPVESVDISGAGLMYSIFPSENIDKASTRVNNLNELSPSKIFKTKELEDINTFLLKPDPIFKNFAVRTNCSGCIESAIKLGINLPYAKIKSGLETDRKSESSVVLVKGWFTSPLVQYFDDKTTSGVQAHLNLWLFYSKKENNHLIDNSYIISEFEGIMGSHIRQQSNNLELNNKLSAEANVSPVEISGDLKTSFNKSDFFKINDWKTIIFYNSSSSGRQLNFYQLPTIKDITDVFKRVDNKFSLNKEKITRGKFEHTINLIDVPENLCSGLWKAKVLTNGVYRNNELQVISTYQAPNIDKYSNKGYCSCQISGIIDDRNFTSNRTDPKKLTIHYELYNDLTLTNKDGNQKLSIEINKDFPTSTEPQVKKIVSPISWGSQSEDNFISLLWEKPITFIDDNRNVNYTIGRRANIISVSRENGLTDLIYNVEIFNNNGAREYQLKINTNSFPKNDLKINELDREVHLNITFEIETSDGTTEQLTTTIPILEPSKVNSNDKDGDNVDDSKDNCKGVYNPDQSDIDGDGIGDKCDNCPDKSNPSQKDDNKNGKGDDCE